MPGSKTYTSNKINELLEHDFLDGVSDLEKHGLKGISSTIFLEILKIGLSLIFTTWVSILTLPDGSNPNDLLFNLKIIAICIIVFIIFYLLVNLIFITGRWLFDALFNLRRFSSQKEKASLDFHKKIVNHIYLGISFENKYNEYISRSTNKENDLMLDLSLNYLSQSVHYFKIASEEINKYIPSDAKRKGMRERKNAEFLNYIGFPLLNISLISAQRSLKRLLTTEGHIREITNSVLAASNRETIKLAYMNSINELFQEIRLYIGDYESKAEKTLRLQKYFHEHSYTP